MSNPFQQYIDLGWKLCRIEPGTKGPRTPGWNSRENALTSAEGLQAAGLLHAYSGTCAIDIDDWDKADQFLQAHGVDLTALMMAPDAVQISSGTAGRAKLLYKLPEPLPTIKVADGKLEFRCATRDGASVQDVLPPSPHPSGRVYTIVGNPAQLPTIPLALKYLWYGLVLPDREQPAPEVRKSENSSRSVTLARMSKIINTFDPDMPHDDWLKVGMALHHESGGTDEGLKIWVEWSSLSKDKFLGYEHVAERYRSFGGSARPVTGDYILHQEVASADDFEVIKADSADFMADPPEANPFMGKFLTRDQWEKKPKPSWFLPKLIPDNGVACLFGPSGSGKSFVAIDLAVTAAVGGVWRGHRLKQGAVACIVAEDAFGFEMRLSAALDTNARHMANVTVLEADVRLQEKQQMIHMIKAIQALGNISLVIVDTLAAATPGIDENSSKDVNLLLAYCRQLQRAVACPVLLVHHTGKDVSKGSRGSSSWKAGFDSELEIEAEALSHSMKVSKVRNAAKFDKNGNRIGFSFVLEEVSETCSVEWV